MRGARPYRAWAGGRTSQAPSRSSCRTTPPGSPVRPSSSTAASRSTADLTWRTSARSDVAACERPHPLLRERYATRGRRVGSEGVGDRVPDGGGRAYDADLSGASGADPVTRGGRLAEQHLDGWRLGGGGHGVVHQATGEQLPFCAVDDLLEEGAADPLHCAALDLPPHDRRVQQRPAVRRGYVPENSDRAGLAIDVHAGDVHRERVRQVGRIEGGRS